MTMNNFKDKLNNFFFLGDEEEMAGVEAAIETQAPPTYEEKKQAETTVETPKVEKSAKKEIWRRECGSNQSKTSTSKAADYNC
jgi:hypothetical protein